MKPILLCAISFFLGSIPTGLLIAKAKGIDLKKSGSGNIGATNVLRTTGKWPALLTLAGDILKGAAAAWLASWSGLDPFAQGIVGLCAIAGHDFSVFLNFRGGKGVATTLGVLSIYSPQTCLFTIIIWLMTATISKYSSLGAIVSFGLLPLSIVILDSGGKFPFAFFAALLIMIKHRDNISRLLKGTETRIGTKS
ncbi:MAG: glycerol-3-phosphate 1-O-acyltransferase PlsY [Nitrospirae bacterium]|nr:glycerol-3-phosphate 1-O-acyltransferase PlsY [Nitrospirota bacterium]